MSREFDQSTFELGLQGFTNPYFTTDYLSDVSQTDLTPGFFSPNDLAQSPANRQQNLKNINNRIKTPVRLNNSIRGLYDFNDV